MLELLGMVFALFCLMSVGLFFDNKKTTKSILVTSVIVLFVWALLNVPGRLDGRLFSWQLFFSIFFYYLFMGIIAIAIVDFIIIKGKFYLKEWYVRKLPWVAGVFYAIIFFIGLSLVVREQISLYKSYKQQSYDVEQVAMLYGFIMSKDMITDWCEPYYSLKNYPMKFAEAFGEIKYNARNFLTQAMIQNGESVSVLVELDSVLTEQAYDSYEKDYSEIKKIKEKEGVQYSKVDYCKMVDEKADFHISNIRQVLETL